MRTQSTGRRPVRSVPDELDGLLRARADAQTGDALYGRTSSDEQAEKGTIKNQQQYLGQRAELEQWPVRGEYWDDGISGTIPLAERPAGHRLLEDARAGRLRRVIVYNLTRLGRTLRVILEAYEQLQACGVEVVSATEPIDTSNPIGRFIFQLLGSLAELDRATTLEKLTGGRDRVAGEGRWTGGPVPYGYDVHPEDAARDGAPRLVPSARLVPELGLTEAAVAVALFEAIDRGGTPAAEVRRLNALGAYSFTRYARQATPTRRTPWSLGRLTDLLHRPIYKGEHTVKSARGAVARTFPALVDEALWERVQRRLAEHRTVSDRETTRPFLLRGLVVCAGCGRRFVGCTVTPRPGQSFTYYRCSGQLAHVHAEPADRCGAKLLAAPRLEADAWAACRERVRRPGATLEALRRQVRERQGQAAAHRRTVAALEATLTRLDGERDKVLTLFRTTQGDLPGLLAGTERQLREVARLEADARAALAAERVREEVDRLAEARLASAGALLAKLREHVDWVDANPAHPEARLRQREVLERLVATVRVTTTGAGRAKRAAAALATVHGEAADLPYVAEAVTLGPDALRCIQAPFVLAAPLPTAPAASAAH
jgi:site-specific DNA recombinase